MLRRVGRVSIASYYNNEPKIVGIAGEAHFACAWEFKVDSEMSSVVDQREYTCVVMHHHVCVQVCLIKAALCFLLRFLRVNLPGFLMV